MNMGVCSTVDIIDYFASVSDEMIRWVTHNNAHTHAHAHNLSGSGNRFYQYANEYAACILSVSFKFTAQKSLPNISEHIVATSSSHIVAARARAPVFLPTWRRQRIGCYKSDWGVVLVVFFVP